MYSTKLFVLQTHRVIVFQISLNKNKTTHIQKLDEVRRCFVAGERCVRWNNQYLALKAEGSVNNVCPPPPSSPCHKHTVSPHECQFSGVFGEIGWSVLTVWCEQLVCVCEIAV